MGVQSRLSEAMEGGMWDFETILSPLADIIMFVIITAVDENLLWPDQSVR